MSQSPRLHVDAAILGYQRGLRNQNNNVSLIKIKGVDSKEDVDFYLGKRVAFITKADVADKYGNKFRVNWGKVCRAHGSNVSSGAVSEETYHRNRLVVKFE